MDSKEGLPQAEDMKRFDVSTTTSDTPRSKGKAWVALLILSIFYCLFRLPAFLKTANTPEPTLDIAEAACPQAAPIRPSRHEELLNRLDELFKTDSFKKTAYDSLGLAVQVQ